MWISKKTVVFSADMVNVNTVALVVVRRCMYAVGFFHRGECETEPLKICPSQSQIRSVTLAPET